MEIPQDQKDGVTGLCHLIGDDLVARISSMVSSEMDATRVERSLPGEEGAAKGSNEGDAAHEKRDSARDVGGPPGEGDATMGSGQGDAAYEMGAALCAWESLASLCCAQVTMRYFPQTLNHKSQSPYLKAYILHPPPSTLNPQPSTLNPQDMAAATSMSTPKTSNPEL